ncbi:MAG TPA: hypothetical protein VK171_02990 [Fimbriimonas sp.]|nr:hypothetical protein [Fimbriimonas sp.]
MSRGRSPLFYFNLFLCWLAATCFFAHWSFNWPLLAGHAEGAPILQTVDQLSTLTLFLTVLLTVGACISFFFEWRISQGWEPRFLETFKPGCQILELLASSVVVEHADGSTDVYVADADEMKELEIGSTCHLWVIGKHLSRIRKLESADPSKPNKGLAGLRLTPGVSLLDGIPKNVLLLSGSALLTGTGFRALVVQEMSGTTGRRSFSERSTYTLTGADAIMGGLIEVVLGLALVGIVAIVWRKGWLLSDVGFGKKPQNLWD